ncbi:MAG TPA: DUF3798 domain-containing protein [Candidatus Eisenbacteria bacterium]
MRRWNALALVLSAVAVAGCSREKGPAPSPKASPATKPFEIGIMTGTVTQGEEDFRAGEQVERRYPGRVRHITYPDNFPSELETVVAQLAGLAADPDVKVILVGQAIPGSTTAARRIRETRPDILLGFVGPHEDPDSVGPACDVAIGPDPIARGVTIIAAAQQMGARNFVHYSFPRHLSQLLVARRRDIMEAECDKRGMRFHAVTAPDPTGRGGLPAAEQFILADVPRELEQLGPATAFYSTSDGMQEPLIRAILEARAGYFVEQDVPAPTQGYPAALGLRVPADSADDMAYVNGENRRLIAERGMSGHFGTWSQAVDMISIRALASLLVDAADRKADVHDSATVRRYLELEAGGPVTMRRYDPHSNQWLIMLDHVTY